MSLFKVLLMVLLPLVVADMASAAPQKTAGGHRERSSRPISVKADELKADNKGKTATFIGRVVSKQDDVTIYSDKLVIYYGEQQEQVDKIEAIGNVRIVQTNRIGTGGHALYENKEGKVTLTINPKVTQDKDSVTGKVIVYFLDEDRSLVTGDTSTRVEAVINPKQGSTKTKSGTTKQK
jgi:lipopolysaccharide export system protein LptA